MRLAIWGAAWCAAAALWAWGGPSGFRHRSVGEVRGLGVFWAIELVADQKTREPLAPYGGSSPAMAAVLAACKSGGLLPFANFNRIHAVPPCNVTDDEVAEGLRILDSALTVADEHAV